LQQGSRVRIEGLQAKPQLHGRTGVVCAFDQETGRWTVDLVADGARPACRGTFRAAHLRLIPSHNFSTEWVDEGGRVWPKNVDFSRQCAKGHALAPLGERGGLADKRRPAARNMALRRRPKKATRPLGRVFCFWVQRFSLNPAVTRR
jgi:hypothetical protein